MYNFASKRHAAPAPAPGYYYVTFSTNNIAFQDKISSAKSNFPILKTSDAKNKNMSDNKNSYFKPDIYMISLVMWLDTT